MGSFGIGDADKYGGNGGTGYFSLKNDGDSAFVRFLYETPEDVLGYAVHQVEIDGKKRYVNCIRSYNEPIDNCPFCKARNPQLSKLFVPIYNVDEDKVQIWERGKKFFAKLSGLFSRYDKHSIVSQEFEIVRNGKAGDTQTTYEIYRTETESDDKTLADFEEPVIIGGLVLDKSKDELEFYLENGYFNDGEERPVRRTQRTSERTERPARRTPSDRF